ncbi:MAG: DNA repair protein RecN [Hyphomicrobiales bacterium]|nr:DNA repair protein RecN [Hyphomicrobiales bacterium]
MLVQLFIQDIVLIDRLDIEFNSSLTVLTGETGAGKSILLDALSLALGARGDGDLVREGANSGQVRAVFSLPADHEVLIRLLTFDALTCENISEDGGFSDVILRRVQSGDGRTRAYINDVPVSVAKLREIGQMLVEIHGQHDDRALVDENLHRAYLDACGGLGSDLQSVAGAWKNWSTAKKQLSSLKLQVDEAAREAGYLRSSVDELDKLAPEPGEEVELADQRQQMIQAQNIAGELSEAEEILSGHNSPVPILASLVRKLERKTAKAPGLLETVIEQIDGAITHLYSAQNELDGAISKSEYDPHALDNAEERLFALRAAARKYSVAVENLPELAIDMANQLSALDHGEERLAILNKHCGELEVEYVRLATNLSKKRAIAGRELVEKVQKELPSLKLDQAKFLIEHDCGAHLAGEYGRDKIEFWVRTNPGTKAGPMFKVASGGELSRFLLALKVVLADNGSAPTLVFDEIDSGAGGSVADAIGRRLARLAENVQVLSVTHAPQVAAKAKHHLLISKAGGGDHIPQVTTRVVQIDGERRRDEIARMLAGASITDEARAAAGRLLNDPI